MLALDHEAQTLARVASLERVISDALAESRPVLRHDPTRIEAEAVDAAEAMRLNGALLDQLPEGTVSGAEECLVLAYTPVDAPFRIMATSTSSTTLSHLMVARNGEAFATATVDQTANASVATCQMDGDDTGQTGFRLTALRFKLSTPGALALSDLTIETV